MADDYSAISTPVGDDYSSISTPVQEQPMELVAAGDPNFKIPEGMKIPGLAIGESKFARGTPFERFKMLVSNPWKKYEASVDQAFKGAEIPRIEAQGEGLAAQTGAAVANTATGVVGGIPSTGGIAALNPITGPATLIYAAPRFIAGGIESLMNISKDKSAQENVESGLGGGLQLFGAKVGLKQGVKGARSGPAALADSIVEPDFNRKYPSITSQADTASSAKTVKGANVAANEIAMAPASKPNLIESELTSQPERLKMAEPKAVTPELIKGMTGQEFTEFFQPEGMSMTSEAVRIGQSTTTEKGINALKELAEKSVEEYEAAKAKKDFNEASGLAYKSQFFREAYESATKTGGFAKDVLTSTEGIAKTLLEDGVFDEAWKEGGGLSGNENQVIIKNGVAYKRNYNQKLGQVLPNYEGNVADYMRSIELHNELFPSTKIKFEGSSKTSDGWAPITSQPEIKGTPATPKEIKSMMAGKGFEPSGGSNFINKESGIIVEDLRPANVLKDSNGNLNVIDSVIKETEPAKPNIDPAKKAYIDELLATKEITPAEHASQLKDIGFVDPYAEIAAPVDRHSAPKSNPNETNVQYEARLINQLINSKQSIKQQNAVQIQSPEGVPVPAQASVGQEVGQQIRRGQEPAFARQEAQAQVTQEPLSTKALAVSPEVERLATDADVAQIAAEHGGGEPPVVPPTAEAAGSSGQPSYRQGLTKFGLGLGKAAEFAKVAVGTIEGNIRAASPRVFGVLRNYENAKADLSLKFEDATLPASRLARRILTTEGNDQLGNLLMSGKIDQAKKLVSDNTRYGEEMSAAIDSVRKALDYAHYIETEARGVENVNYIKDYFPRQLINYNEFRKALGKQEQAAADQAIKRAQNASETPLTPQEISDVVNNFISQSRAGGGKPGFLKPRTIQTIDSNISKFYEPWDVALENYLRKVTNDVTNRAYFGKFTPEEGAVFNPENGHFGKVIAEEIAAGRLVGRGQDIVIDNLMDRFKMERTRSDLMSDIGAKIRFAQTAGFLGQLSTAVAQYGDVFQQLLHYGPIDTVKGNLNRRVKLRDFGLHEGNVETSQFSRRRGLVDKAGELVVKFGVGLSDQFNKGGTANVIARHFADVVREPDSAAFDSLRRKYEQRFPDQWPDMLKELSTKEFQDGNIKNLPNAQAFLYNEMADVYPINPSGMAQGYNAAHPLAKPFWGLKSYMIKQLDIMRDRGYEKLKEPSTRGEGLAYLAAYAAIVAAGQNFAISWFRDKLANRDTETADYFVGGMLQPFGLSRYTITQMRKGEYGKALAEQLLPALTLAKEATSDLALTRDMLAGRRDKKTGERTVKNLSDLLEQSESVKHFPVIGSIYYNRFGAGAKREEKKRQEKAKGKAQPTTLQTLTEIIDPKETSKRN
jgi:hypothetical protein